MPELRAAEPERHAAGCAAIYEPFVSATAVSFEEEPPSAEQMAVRIAETTKTHPWLVLEGEDGAVLGFAYGAQHRDRAAYRWAVDVTVYVGESYRRQGAGRRLYLALFELLEAQELRIAIAGITEPNEASIALHRAVGFEPVGTYRSIGFKLGAWHDVSWWQRALGDADKSPPAEIRPPAG